MSPEPNSYHVNGYLCQGQEGELSLSKVSTIHHVFVMMELTCMVGKHVWHQSLTIGIEAYRISSGETEIHTILHSTLKFQQYSLTLLSSHYSLHFTT